LASRTRCRAGVTHRRVATTLGPHAEAGFGPLVHAPPPPLPNRHPGPLPMRHASTHAAPTGQLRRRRTRAARPLHGYWPSRLATASRCPCRGRPSPPTQGTHAYKGVKLASARIAPGTEPPLPPPATPSSSLRPLIPPMCVAPACLSTPSSYPARLLLRPSRQLAESGLPRPPSGSLYRTRASARSPSQWALVASPLGHTEAMCAAYCSAGPFPLPNIAPPRLCCPGAAAAAARRRPLRPSFTLQSLRGEPNRFPRRLFAYPCTPSPPTSSPSPSVPRGEVRT
jgi:hypothetical protein